MKVGGRIVKPGLTAEACDSGAIFYILFKSNLVAIYIEEEIRASLSVTSDSNVVNLQASLPRLINTPSFVAAAYIITPSR